MKKIYPTKRMLAMVVSVTLIIFLMPANAFAGTHCFCEEGVPTYEEVKEYAAQIFPEYADRIFSAPTPDNMENPEEVLNEIVLRESRKLSVSEDITYIEYASGIVNLFYQKTVHTNSSIPGNNYISYNVSVVGTCSICTEGITIANLQYAVYNNTYDRMTSPGTGFTGTTVTPYVYYYNMETSTHPAAVSYAGACAVLLDLQDYLGSTFLLNLEAKVSNNQFTVYINGSAV